MHSFKRRQESRGHSDASAFCSMFKVSHMLNVFDWNNTRHCARTDTRTDIWVFSKTHRDVGPISHDAIRYRLFKEFVKIQSGRLQFKRCKNTASIFEFFVSNLDAKIVYPVLHCRSHCLLTFWTETNQTDNISQTINLRHT